ncbi:MAG: cytochrome c3 family protein [Deltaproteobacteria bacterium]|nr:cytochrome c3 family protein [Deltaproteobacteria bacterium]
MGFRYIIKTISAGILCIALFFPGSMIFAQPEEIILNHTENSKEKRRPSVIFPHELHMESYECLDCHHKYENGENVLDEDELEEDNPAAKCSGCHDLENKCDLQKTFHRQCLNCHVNNKIPGEKPGPRMCIGCHEENK